MFGMLNISKSGMMTNQDKIDCISNNVSNVNTNGYKKIDTQFSDLLIEKMNGKSYPVNSKDSLTGTGVKSNTPIRNQAQGALKETERPSNLAIEGEGYFRVITKDGSYAYTRNGDFNIDSFGQIVDSSGNLLDIQFDNNLNYTNLDINYQNLQIKPSGEVLVNEERVGQINLYKTIADDSFISVGDNLFTLAEDATLQEVLSKTIHQGYVETSNVDLSEEMSQLIINQRAYQLNAKGMQTADSMWGMALNLQK